MGDEATVVEVSLFAGKVLVTLSDGRVALLTSGQIQPFAVQPKTLTPWLLGAQERRGAA